MGKPALQNTTDTTGSIDSIFVTKLLLHKEVGQSKPGSFQSSQRMISKVES